ncbi:hypothetical protein M3Y94_00679900 [Aphelenchoides besseyi]|nr:hypothetical protein M3Y94_00679900 [Aphelenchoides besseyi]
MDLAVSYSPQNFYCYAIDSNASSLFHKRMHALADCFPNVFLTKHEFHMDSAGHNMGYSHRECMLVLAKPELKWNYLILLQNHDVPLKTNEELVQIFQWYDGANDISANSVPWERVNKNANWTFEAMHLFKNETKNLLPFKGYKPTLRLAKSLVQVSVSRAMIDFMVNDLDLSGLMKNIEWKVYGIDELLMGSLNSADAVNAPGGFTDFCLDHHTGDSSMTRLTIWMDGKAKCPTKWRHWICLFGVEHLQDLKHRDHLFANKFLPSFDFGAIVCWYEELFKRRHYDRGMHRLNSKVYLNLPHVRFNRERKKLGDKFNVTQFACKG